MAASPSIIPVERIASRIYLIRGDKVMRDSDLADLYGVPTGPFERASQAKQGPLSQGFCLPAPAIRIRLFDVANCDIKWRHGGRRKLPWVFTEHGVAMLSSVLHSKRAVQVNIDIIRAFVRLREILATHKDLARKVERHDQQIAVLFDSLQKLLAPSATKKNPIGYIHSKD